MMRKMVRHKKIKRDCVVSNRNVCRKDIIHSNNELGWDLAGSNLQKLYVGTHIKITFSY